MKRRSLAALLSIFAVVDGAAVSESCRWLHGRHVCWIDDAKSSWDCDTLQQPKVRPGKLLDLFCLLRDGNVFFSIGVNVCEQLLAPGVTWTKLSCSISAAAAPWHASVQGAVGAGTGAGGWAVGPLVFNLVEADLLQPGVAVVPAVADKSAAYPYGLAPLDAIATFANNGTSKNLLAGVNGGYFFRLDEKNFFDNVCIGKTAEMASQPVDPAHPSRGVSVRKRPNAKALRLPPISRTFVFLLE
jgi:hypothetical protein